jgi:hypothetical protein
MSSIAIIDDNVEISETLKLNIKQQLENFNSPFDVITKFPFKDVNDYFEFFTRNNVCVLILDERLNDKSNDMSGPVDYKGNQLVTIIRERLKDFPIFSITTYSDDTDLQSKLSEFEYIVQRDKFVEESESYVPIIIRAANRFLESNRDELSEFNRLTMEIAGGDTDPKKIQQLQALQLKLELPYTGFDDRKNWLDKYEVHIAELEKLKTELQKNIH